MRLKNKWATLMVESSCHHAIFDDGGLALGYIVPPPPQPKPSLAARAVRPRRHFGRRGRRAAQGGHGVSANSVFSWCASLWPCTEPSNRSEGLRKTRTNFGHNLLQLQRVAFHTLEAKRSKGSEPLRLGRLGRSAS